VISAHDHERDILLVSLECAHLLTSYDIQPLKWLTLYVTVTCIEDQFQSIGCREKRGTLGGDGTGIRNV
jgi:hypothetical protein